MLRIAELNDQNGSASLRLEGKVVGPWVDELRRTADRVLGRSGAMVADLSAVTFADAAGICLLRELARRGVTFVNCSAFANAHLGDSGCLGAME